jgi:protein-disulfide isomerase
MGFVDSLGGPVLVGSVAVVIVVVLGLVWLNRPGSTAGTGDFELVSREQVSGRTWGDPDAPVRMIVFEDFQCPVCERHTESVEPTIASELIETGQVSYEFHHLAFLGPESIQAASAAECALEQGQFWPYHDVLFLRQGAENSGVFTKANLKRYGTEVDAVLPADAWDQAAFESCVDSERMRPVVEQQTAEAQQTGIRSTPSFLVNGAQLTGLQSIEQIRQAVAAAR